MAIRMPVMAMLLVLSLLPLLAEALPAANSSAAQVCGVGTVCAAAYSGNGHGCCPYDGAVCCPNRQTCCPAGFACEDKGTYLTTCTKAGQPSSAGLSVCKPGAAEPPSTTLPNVLIIGDSVSIGYTPPVAMHMAKVAKVQHSPLDHADGGHSATGGIERHGGG